MRTDCAVDDADPARSYLPLRAPQDSRSVLGVLQALDCWLAEDHSR